MPPILHLPLSVFLLAAFFLPVKAKTLFDYPTAILNTTWTNSEPLIHDMATYGDGSKIRTILLRGADGPCFAAGFFCPGPCNGGYLFSIFVVNTSTDSEVVDKPEMTPPVLWSANRNRLVGENATLNFTKNGNFILLDEDGSLVWSTNTANLSVSSMKLTYSGNLILLDSKNKSVWSSFENPTDTLLDGQMLIHGKSLFSNSSVVNAARGRFFLSLQDQGFYAYVDSNPPQLYAKVLKFHPLAPSSTYLSFNNGALEWPGDSVAVVSNPTSWSIQFIRLEFDGHLRIYGVGINYIPGVTILQDYSNYILNYCDYPMVCGRYGICSNGQCSCPVNASNGDSSFFRPISWGQVNPGCSLVNPISCNLTESHRLLPLGNISYFNYIDENAAALRATDEESCKQACLKNCSCKAALFKYPNNVSVGDCYLPTEIFSLKNTSSIGYSSSAYIKVQIIAASSPPSSKKKSKIVLIIALTTIPGSLVLTSILVFVFLKRFKTRTYHEMEEDDQFDQVASVLTRFSFEELQILTEGFKRKIGQGGFGSVFEGTLRNGTKVAVKKLEGVGQGKKEFLAEVETIGSIHHINLVQLIGFCAEKSYRLLVYEFMPNRSLDYWIFGREEEAFLTWEVRRNIILDIAKGLCYLHEECRQRIAHLDIKPQNILLDEKFNAKLADFGLSKLIDREQSEVMTRMRGTPGYLAPEWLTSIITEKVDVYSFGVVILEIMSGRKNLDPLQPEKAVHLIALLDTFKADSVPDIFRGNSSDVKLQSEDEIRMMMRLAVWCLQSESKRRPSMSTVVRILEASMNLECNIDYEFIEFQPFMMESTVQSASQFLPSTWRRSPSASATSTTSTSTQQAEF